MGKRSDALHERATKVMPGGVNSPVRAFRSVGGTPRFIEQGQGSRIFDVDNLQYLDCVCSWGTLILGHAHRYVVEAVKRAATRGCSFGAPTEGEVDLAETISAAMPSVEMVRLVSSGTEAIICTIRIARAATGRKLLLKFDGGYHGHLDSMLQRADAPSTAGAPETPGIPDEVAELTLSVPYNDLGAARRVFERYPHEIAAVIVEPVAGSMGVIPPADGFLQGLRELCDSHRTLLIFDEVVTGFRVAFEGGQGRYGVRPDLTTLGRIIGGGLPMGGYGGRRDLMEMVAPLGPVYQGGTLAGNPIAVAAGRSTLSILKNEGIYRELEERSAEFEAGVRHSAKKHGVPIQFNRVASMWTIFFSTEPITDLASARNASTDRYATFFHALLGDGVYLPPSQFEAAFFSAAHAKKDIQQLIERVDRGMKKVAWEYED